MSYRIAKSLDVLRGQVNLAYPKRSTASDGWIGDPAHSSRESDHNPDPQGIVRALDITHDPDHGADMNALTKSLVEARDPRIKYIIWNRRIVSSTTNPWVWRTYSGTNPHDKHAHISVVPDGRADSLHPWAIQGKDWFDMATKAELKEVVREVIKELAVGSDQKDWNSKHINLKDVEKRIRAEKT